ncbi:hypothetical protein GGQ92_000848 [Gracilibacillus halotolerans]|uniref:Uncharacterized protein n=1 Tax=Gracilibacillus halotolerans TaxID=74386 RepID=A0A841RJM2_9BACI|nr:hypothetical protein [Gracilibacillus halotolerans]MBB6512067.1 hypothetical protein [Gracilibacillus halotolerans]
MAIASKLTSIGFIIGSFAIGILSYYLFAEQSKKEKKKHIEEIISQLINLVIFIWVGKILLNLSIFLSDPLSILAYPSDSSAFYFAIGLSSITFIYQSIRKKKEIIPIIEAFIPIFLISSFVYEFSQYVINDNATSFGYIILLGILIILFLFLNVSHKLLALVMVWSVGLLILSTIQPFVMVFGYIMEPWFIGLLFVMSTVIISFANRREKQTWQ